MPSKSKAQFRKMGFLYAHGKITRAQLRRFNKGVNYKRLPNRVRKRRRRK